jgi:hypothetical protein
MKKLLAIFLMISAPFARPDSCVLPSTTGYVSDDGTTVVRIEFGRPKTFYPDPKDCVARIARWHEEDRSYRFVRSVVLRNPVGPGEAVISNDARFLVTFDDFCESGTTENAVVIYDLEKGTVIACGIEDFLPRRTARHSTVRCRTLTGATVTLTSMMRTGRSGFRQIATAKRIFPLS